MLMKNDPGNYDNFVLDQSLSAEGESVSGRGGGENEDADIVNIYSFTYSVKVLMGH